MDVFYLEGQEGLGHILRPREFTIDDQSSSEHRSQSAAGTFRPRHHFVARRVFKLLPRLATQKPHHKVRF
jgi:hypothetical protein